MANDYLSIEEACEKLGMTEEQVKGLVSDGALREFRDAGKVLYSISEVDEVAGKNGSSVVDLEATDEAAPGEIDLDENESFASALSDLADSSAGLGALDASPAVDEPPAVEPEAGGSGSSFALTDAPGEGEPAAIDMDSIPEELPAAPRGDAEPEIADLSSEIDLLPDADGTDAGINAVPAGDDGLPGVPDLGLSGSSIISLEPSGDTGMMDSPIAKEGTKVAKVGISVFDDDEIEVETDPMGETQISTGVDDFDAVGSGSGLLDLTQEPDDSSLGPELLDVISPSEAADDDIEVEAVDEDTLDDSAGSAMAVMEEEEAVEAMPMSPVAAKTRVATGEMAGAAPMNVCLLLGLLGLITLGLATASALQGVWPSVVMDHISSGVVHWSVFGGLALVSIVTGVVALLAGRK